MLRKHNKLVVLFVLLTFLFSIVGTASAATFSDIDKSDAKDEIYKLSALGILAGYPDGTFQPDNTITRAEFAKIAVVTSGLGEAAEGYASVKAPFSDVATDDWFNGFVSVAAAQGYVKGYPDGTFAPQAQITQQEVITVLMRLLGYNDNLPGDWPFDYLAKAKKLGITDDIKLAAALPATRGIVAILTEATLDQNVVDYDADKNSFDEGLNPETLLSENFKESAWTSDEVYCIGVSVDDNKRQFVVLEDTNEDGDLADAVDKVTYELADDALIVGAANWLYIRENFVKFITYDDDGDEMVSYVEVINNGKVSFTPNAPEFAVTVQGTTGNVTKIEIDDTEYTVLEDAIHPDAWEELATGAEGAAKSYTYTDYEYIKVVPNEDGDIMGIYASDSAQYGAVIEEVNVEKNTIKFFAKDAGGKFTSTTIDADDYDADEFFVTINGAPAALEDLKPGMIAYRNTARDAEMYVDAYNKPVEGTLEEVNTTGTEIVIDGKTYYTALTTGNPGTLAVMLSTDNGEEFAKTTDVADIEDLVGEKVKIMLGILGSVDAIISDGEGESNKIYGILTEMVADLETASGTEKDYVTIFKADGTEATYEVDEDSELDGITIADNADPAAFVWLTLSSDGQTVDELTFIADINDAQDATDIDGKRIELDDTNWVVANDNVKVFNTLDTEDDDATVESWADFANFVDDAVGPNFPEIYAYSIDDDGEIDYIVVFEGNVGSGDAYMVMGKGKNADGYYVKLDRNETTQIFLVDDKTTQDLVTTGDVVKYTKSGNEINGFTVLFDEETGTLPDKVYDVKSDRVQINDNWYTVDEDSVIYNIEDGDDPEAITLSDLSDDDMVKFGSTDGAIDWLVVKLD